MDYPRGLNTTIWVSNRPFIISNSHLPHCRPTFPSTCLSPDQPGYGQVVANGGTRRRMRRNNTAAPSKSSLAQANWTVVTPSSGPNPTTMVTTRTTGSSTMGAPTTKTTPHLAHKSSRQNIPILSAPASYYHASPPDRRTSHLPSPQHAYPHSISISIPTSTPYPGAKST